MNIVALLPFILLIGAMFLMTRSAKNKQRAAASMRNQMEPGAGVRTIGGMYATVKEVHEDTVLLEVAPGVHAFYAKNAVGAVLDDAEYNHIVHGIEPEDVDVPDDASSLIEDEAAAHAPDAAPGDADDAEGVEAEGDAGQDAKKVDLGKADPDATTADADESEDASEDDDTGAK